MGIFQNKPSSFDELSRKMDMLIEALLSQNTATKPADNVVTIEQTEIILEAQEVLSPTEEVLASSEEVTATPEEDTSTTEELPSPTVEKPSVEEPKVEKPSPEVKVDEPEVAPSAVAGDKTLAELVTKLNAMQNLLEENNRKDSIIKELHAELQEHKRDIYSDLTKPLLNNILKIHKNMYELYLHFSKNLGKENNPLTLEQMLKALDNQVVSIKDMLEDEYDLEYFEPKKGDVYSPKEHHALEALETEDESLVGTIYACKIGGFRNVNTEKIFKPAFVSVYKSNKK